MSKTNSLAMFYSVHKGGEKSNQKKDFREKN